MTDFDLPVRVWWLALCACAVLNVSLWSVSARRYLQRVAREPPFAARGAQLWLSGVYVVICGFRGILPRADVQRICLFDTWLSSIAVGRSVATVAELACALQWALLLAELGRSTQLSAVSRVARLIVPLIVVAEVCSWYAVLTTNYLGNTIEESCWTLMAGLLGQSFWSLRARAPALKTWLTVGAIGCVAYIVFMLSIDVRMYFVRWRADEAAGRAYLALADGLHDVSRRWVVTGAWTQWRPEIAWMTLYFSAAVWAMVSLTHAPRFAAPAREASDPAAAP
jgi:hypothetical protein